MTVSILAELTEYGATNNQKLIKSSHGANLFVDTSGKGLRERKRHSARRVASTASVVLAGGYPIPEWSTPSQVGGTPSQDGRVVSHPGVPSCPDLAGGYPIPAWGYPGVHPRKDMGPVEVLWDGDGVPPLPRCEQYLSVALRTRAEIIVFPNS